MARIIVLRNTVCFHLVISFRICCTTHFSCDFCYIMSMRALSGPLSGICAAGTRNYTGLAMIPRHRVIIRRRGFCRCPPICQGRGPIMLGHWAAVIMATRRGLRLSPGSLSFSINLLTGLGFHLIFDIFPRCVAVAKEVIFCSRDHSAAGITVEI